MKQIVAIFSFFVFTFLLFAGTASAQPELLLEWAKGTLCAPTGGADVGYAIAVDASGNTYITGTFEGTADFDPGSGTVNLVSNGIRDIFLAKYDASGNYVYAKSMGGSSADDGRGIAVDGNGNTYITGSFRGTVDFDPGSGTANLISSGGSDIFLAKYDASGNYVYAKNMGGTSFEYGRCIAVDGSGNAYITGQFFGTVDFDPGSSTANLTSSGSYDIFLAKYDASGNYLYAKAMGGTSYDLGFGIDVDGNGNAYITGYFQSTADFDPGSGTANLVSSGSSDIFLTKYDASGNYVYAKKIGGASYDDGTAIAVDGSGNAYITGSFQGTVDFDPGSGTANLVSSGLSDIFLAKYNSSGNYVYAKKMGSTSNDYGYGIAVDGSGNAYITGGFIGTVDFDPGSGTVNLVSNGSLDIFLAKYNSSGNYVYAKKMGGTIDDYGYGIAVDGSGNAYITGNFYGTVDFDPGSGTANLFSTSDIFLAKYDASGNYVYAGQMGLYSSSNYVLPRAVVLDASGNAYITGYYQGTADFDPGSGTANLVSSGNNDIFLAKYDASGNYVYAKNIGGTSDDYGYGIAVDGSGNAYITGTFQGTVDFDPGSGTVNLTSSGDNDIFLAKYDASGNYVYAKKMGGTSPEGGIGIAVDGSGNAYITGYFYGTVDFDPGSGTANLTSSGSTDIFLAKYNSSGNYVYAKKMGSTGDDIGNGIAVDGSGNAYITGQFFGTVDFDPGSGTVNVTSSGSTDIFLAKYDASGNYVYAKKMGGTSGEDGKGIVLDGSGNAYITGQFFGTVDFDPGSSTANLTSSGSYDIFLAKYDASGNYLYAKAMGGTSYDLGFGIDVDGNGNAYITGYFQSTADFDPGSGTANLVSTGANDIFLAKYDASGNYVYAKKMGGTSSEEGRGIAVDGSGSAYISGSFRNTADFDPSVGTFNLTAGNSSDEGFIAKYTECTAPTQPTAISGNNPACPNSSQTYSVAVVTGATSYTWTLPAGWSGISTTNSITVTTNGSGGTLEVTANNACGSSTAQTLAISITNLDDGVPCTIDGCDPATGLATHVPSDALADDGLWCNGVETCHPTLGVQSGTPPVIDDGNFCTDDACDEVNDQVVHTNNTGPCDDGDPNTINDQCVNGVCQGTPIVTGNHWTGNTNTNWNNPGNWSSGVVPNGSTDAIIPTTPAGGVFPIMNVNTAAVNDIELQGGATLTIPAGMALTVNGVLTNNGTVYVNNSGSLVQTTGSTLAGSGSYQVQRQGATGQRFNFWSSPITAQSSVPGNPSYTYNPNTSTQDDSDDSPSDPGWSSYNGSMTPGAGYAGSGAGTVTFSGTVNNGNITVPLVYHAFDNTYTQTTPGTPFNLVGNPYPSAISAAQLIANNSNIDGTIYFWDDDLSGGTDYSRTDFAYWNGTGGLGTGAGSAGAPNGSISTAQGFYVRALSGGTLTFNNGQRVAGPNTQFLKPNGADSRLWFSIESADHFDQVLIGALGDATEEEDRLYDAIKMRSANGISLSAVDNDVEHAIMAFPPPAANKTIPLRVNTTASGTHTFTAQTVENFGEFAIYLDDAQTGNSYQLQEGVGVAVTLAAGEYLNRFYLNLIRTSFTGIEDTEESPLTAYAANGMLHVRSALGNQQAQLQLHDMGGRLVYATSTALSAGSTVANVHNLPKGIYVLTVSTANAVHTAKVAVW